MEAQVTRPPCDQTDAELLEIARRIVERRILYFLSRKLEIELDAQYREIHEELGRRRGLANVEV